MFFVGVNEFVFLSVPLEAFLFSAHLGSPSLCFWNHQALEDNLKMIFPAQSCQRNLFISSLSCWVEFSKIRAIFLLNFWQTFGNFLRNLSAILSVFKLLCVGKNVQRWKMHPLFCFAIAGSMPMGCGWRTRVISAPGEMNRGLLLFCR